MKLHLQQELQNRGTATLISYKPNDNVNRKLESNSDALKVDIKTHPGEFGSETISFYIPVSKWGFPEA